MLLQFFLWWRRQFASLIPAGIRASVARMRPKLLLRLTSIPHGVAVVEATLRRAGSTRLLGIFDLTEDGLARLRQATERNAGLADLILELDDGSVIDRELSLPLAVENGLQQALAYEFDHETPFTPDEVYWTAKIIARDRQNGTLSVCLAMVLKRKLDPLLHVLRRAGLSPRQVIGEGVTVRLPRWKDDTRFGRIPILAIGGAAAAFCLIALAFPFIAQGVALQRAATRIAALQPAALEVQRLRKQTGDDMREQQAVMGDPLIMLAALTDILPDDTRLIGLSLHERNLELIGQSSASSLLIGRLAKSPDFENPIFSAPVTRAENAPEDTFSIKVQFTQ